MATVHPPEEKHLCLVEQKDKEKEKEMKIKRKNTELLIFEGTYFQKEAVDGLR